jgi:hypothetical protein
MQLENYFEFLSEEDIRIRGTRVGIETVLEDYLEGSSPEEIAARYRRIKQQQPRNGTPSIDTAALSSSRPSRC